MKVLEDSDSEDPAASESPPAKGRMRLRACLLALIGVLYVLSVPWYRETGAPLNLILGLPDWVAVAIGCYLGVAVLNSGAWMLTDVRDDDEREPGASGNGGRRG